MEKEKVDTSSSVSILLEKEHSYIHSESQQNKERLFVTEVI